MLALRHAGHKHPWAASTGMIFGRSKHQQRDSPEVIPQKKVVPHTGQIGKLLLNGRVLSDITAKFSRWDRGWSIAGIDLFTASKTCYLYSRHPDFRTSRAHPPILKPLSCGSAFTIRIIDLGLLLLRYYGDTTSDPSIMFVRA